MDEGLKKRVKKVVDEVLPAGQFKVGIFGSRAAGSPAKYSDVDLAVWGSKPASGGIMGHLRDAFEESDIPYLVDVVDLHRTSSKFRDIVLQEAIWL